jgi:hypothetical protein
MRDTETNDFPKLRFNSPSAESSFHVSLTVLGEPGESDHFVVVDNILREFSFPFETPVLAALNK